MVETDSWSSGTLVHIILTAFLFLLPTTVSRGMDFLEKRDCTLGFGKNRAPVHTRCIISGGMQGGTIDASIRTPGGKTYALEGPIDGEDGHKFLLQKRPASNFQNDAADESKCYMRNDEKLTICFGAIVE